MKLLLGCEGLHVCPKIFMLPNADPGELNPKDWLNDEGWLAAAATDPNNPLDAAVVEGEPKIEDVVVDAEPNIEVGDAGIVWLLNIDELVVTWEPKIVLVVGLDPKPPVIFVGVVDPNIEETVVEDGAPNIDEVGFVAFPKIDDEVVVTEVLKIEEVVIVLVDVANIDDEVVAFVGVPKIDEPLIAFVVVPKIDEVLVVLVGVLKTDGWSIVLLVFSKILVVLVELIEVPNIEVLVDGISKSGVLLAVVGIVGIFSFSGVIGSDIIGIGLSETLGVFSVKLLDVVVISCTVLKSDVVLTTSKVEGIVEEPTGSLIIVGSVFDAREKLNDAVAVVDIADVNIDLGSNDMVFAISSLGAAKLNVENDGSGLELKLKEANVGSFNTVSCLVFFDLSSVMSPEKMLGVSKGLDKVFDTSKLKVVPDPSCRLSNLLFIESVKLKVFIILLFGTVVSDFTEDALLKLKGVFSFESTPEIISNVDFVETKLRVLLKFMGVVVDDFKLKSTGSLLQALVEVILLPNIETGAAELTIIGSLVRTLKSNLFIVAGLEVEILSSGFHTDVMPAFVDNGLDPNENILLMEIAVIDLIASVCVVGINMGFFNCVNSDIDDSTSVAFFSSLELSFLFNIKGFCEKLDLKFSFVSIEVKSIGFSWTFCFDNGFKGVLHIVLLISMFA